MEDYIIPEGRFTVPNGFTDRTIHTFILNSAGKNQFNLTLSRDNLLADESIEAYVARQLAILRKNIKGYKLLKQFNCQLGTKNEGVEVYGTWKEGAQTIWQRQAAFNVLQQNVLIFSATSAKAFDQQTDKYWRDWLVSFR